MSSDLLTCVYCRLPKDTFTKEHVVPFSFGATNKYLKDLVCADCNRTFNESFEGRFLKGPGVESILRSMKGQKGRHDFPVFGDGSYGNRLLAKVREQFPPIQVTVSKEGVRAPLQLISVSGGRELFHSLYEGPQFGGTLSSLIADLWSRKPDSMNAVGVFLWIRDTDINVAGYRLIRKEFFKFLGTLCLDGDFLCDSLEGFPTELAWNTSERQRMYSKICLNTLFFLFPNPTFCLLQNFDPLRSFILTGLPAENAFVKQCTSPSNPIVEMIGLEYDLCVGLFEYRDRLFGTVYIPQIGIFVVDIGPKPELPFAHLVQGFPPMDNDLCIFYHTRSGQDLSTCVLRPIALEIRNRLVKDGLLD